MADALHRVTKEIRTSVDQFSVDPAVYLVFAKDRDNSDYDALVAAGVPTKYWDIVADRVEEMDQGGKDTVDANDLLLAKRNGLIEVDNEAERRVHDGAGFEWPGGSGVFFSLSANAQQKWSHFYLARNLLPYPVRVYSLHNVVSHDVVDAAEMEKIYETVALTVHKLLDDAIKVKDQIIVATTITEVEQLVDDYKKG